MMFKTTVVLVAVLGLSACGGSRYASRNAVPDSAPPPAPVFQPAPPISGAALPASVLAPAAPVVTTAAAAPAPAPAPVVRFARGPIQKACQASDRKARSRARCGCIQAVADDELTAAQQRRGASFWKNPGKLQDVRQSDNAANERFWKAWKAYGQSAARVCKNT